MDVTFRSLRFHPAIVSVTRLKRTSHCRRRRRWRRECAYSPHLRRKRRTVANRSKNKRSERHGKSVGNRGGLPHFSNKAYHFRVNFRAGGFELIAELSACHNRAVFHIAGQHLPSPVRRRLQ